MQSASSLGWVQLNRWKVSNRKMHASAKFKGREKNSQYEFYSLSLFTSIYFPQSSSHMNLIHRAAVPVPIYASVVLGWHCNRLFYPIAHFTLKGYLSNWSRAMEHLRFVLYCQGQLWSLPSPSNSRVKLSNHLSGRGGHGMTHKSEIK